MEPRYLDVRVGALLDAVASEASAAAGGSSAALVTAVAASLVAKAGRLSRGGWSEAGGAVAQAEALRRRATHLAEADAVAYEDALAVLRAAVPGPSASERDATIGDALARAAGIPLLIAQTASDVALLAAEVAEGGDPEAAAEAGVGALLAAAAARSARHLVGVNLGMVAGDPRAAQGDKLVMTASTAAQRALAGADSVPV